MGPGPHKPIRRDRPFAYKLLHQFHHVFGWWVAPLGGRGLSGLIVMPFSNHAKGVHQECTRSTPRTLWYVTVPAWSAPGASSFQPWLEQVFSQRADDLQTTVTLAIFIKNNNKIRLLFLVDAWCTPHTPSQMMEQIFSLQEWKSAPLGALQAWLEHGVFPKGILVAMIGTSFYWKCTPGALLLHDWKTPLLDHKALTQRLKWVPVFLGHIIYPIDQETRLKKCDPPPKSDAWISIGN